MTNGGGSIDTWRICDDAFGQSARNWLEHYLSGKYENCRWQPGQAMEACIVALQRMVGGKNSFIHL
eukprot:2439706-Amphidinium_carterae.1